MTIQEMHTMFREIGQQMGIQTTRAIFPENIDICLNIAIDKIVRSLISSNVGDGISDKGQLDNSRFSTLNSLISLQRQSIINKSEIVGDGSWENPYSIYFPTGVLYLLLHVDLRIDVRPPARCRIIEPEVLYDTINDYTNRPSVLHPICSVFAKDDNSIDINLYTGVIKQIIPNQVLVTYLTAPDKVSLENNISCNLPIHLHHSIVIDAVEVYLKSLSMGNAGRDTNPTNQ